MAYLRIIRPLNLLFVALTMYLVRHSIILHLLRDIPSGMEEWQFALLVLGTMCIAAAGYIINDYFDTDTDRINRPEKLIIGRSISRKHAIRYHLALNGVGVALALYVGIAVGSYKLAGLYVFVAGLLWFYSSSFKGIAVLGNLIVSLVTALVVFIPVFFERELYQEGNDLLNSLGGLIMLPTIGYAGFAFITTWIREIVKDLEDAEGDDVAGMRTLNLLAGDAVAKGLATLLFGVFTGLLYYGAFRFFDAWYLITLVLPALAATVWMWMAKTSKHYHYISWIWKIVMLLGILSMLLILN